MPIKFRCPQCKQAYTISSSKAGSKIRCQKCEAKIRIPEVDGAASATATSPEASSGTGASGASASTTAQAKEEQTQPANEAVSSELQSAFDNLFDDDDEMFQDSGEPDGLEESGLIDQEDDDAADDDSDTGGPEAADPVVEAARTDNVAQNALLAALDDDDDDAPNDEAAESIWGRPSAKTAADQRDNDAEGVNFDEAREPADAAPAKSARRPVAAPLPSEMLGGDGDDEEEEGLFAGKDNEDEEMDLTPMVDVTFLLLIFFMITASFSIQKTLEVPPPDPEEKGQSQSIIQPEEIEETSIEIRIDARNMVTVEEEPVNNLDQLPAIMRGKRKPEILIVAHEQAMHEVVVKVVDAANEIGIQKIRMATTSGDD